MKLKLFTLGLILFSLSGYTSVTYSNFVDNETTQATFTAAGCDDECGATSEESFSPEASLVISNDLTETGFVLNNVSGFDSFDYTILITHENELGQTQDAVVGTLENEGNASTLAKDDITLGTCSTNGTCVYYDEISEITLEIELFIDTTSTETLTDSLTFE